MFTKYKLRSALAMWDRSKIFHQDNITKMRACKQAAIEHGDVAHAEDLSRRILNEVRQIDVVIRYRRETEFGVPDETSNW